MGINGRTCPACGAGPGTLSITERMRAKPLGSHSLSGAQMKVSATLLPVLHCSACSLEREGRYTSPRHADFSLQDTEEAPE
jgi:hypothetical protein